MSVSAASTPVQAQGIGGAVDVETSYAGVRLEDIGGSIRVRNQSGAVRVEDLSGAALRGEHRIETSYADIHFFWPGDSDVTYLLESTYGSIESCLPGTLKKSGSRHVMEGTVGSGSARITLITKSGSIRLEED